MKCVYRANDGYDIFLAQLKEELKSQGIEFTIKNEYLSGSMSYICGPEIWVEENDFKQAVSYIKDAKNAQTMMKSWFCNNCEIEIEKQFGACWKCGNSN